jgi:hypothetical protein
VHRFSTELRIHLPHHRNSIVPQAKRSKQIVVSLTSYPARIASVWLTIESILRQDFPPDRLVLVLSRDEFPEGRLPKKLLGATRRGLEILWVEGNSRSYKKLLPTRTRFPNSVIVTADDDVIYPPWWLQALVSAHYERPSYILAHRANEIVLGRDARPLPYLQWRHSTRQTPSHLVFPTGVGGVLYPPASLPSIADNQHLALTLCPTTDDVWFKVMALMAHTPTAVVSDTFQEFHTTRRTQRDALIHVNVEGQGNDRQLAAALDHFDLWRTLARVAN